MVSRDEAEAYRQAQIGVRALVERDLAKFWSYLDLSNPARVASAVDSYVPLLVRRFGSDAGEFAAEWYDEMRASAGPGVGRVGPRGGRPHLRGVTAHDAHDTGAAGAAQRHDPRLPDRP